MASATDLLSPSAPAIPTKSVAIDIAATDHQLDTAANGKPTLAPFARRLFIGTGGDIVVRLAGNAADVTYKVATGAYITGAFTKVTRTGTTASNIVAEQ